MTTLITTVVNTPSAEIASKTFVAATYLPITGATTGATSQAQTFTNGVNLSNLTPGRIPYASTAGLLVDSSTLTYSATTGLATTKPVTITGSTDAVQFKILGNATQTNHILDVFASDGTTARFHITGDGKVGIGTTAPSTKLHVISTTEQLRLGYDASNYLSATIGSTGSATLALTGTTPTFTFSQKIIHGAATNLKAYTVATLPTGVRGDLAYVTDALLPTYLATIAGGGAVVTPVFYDGTNWIAH